MSPRANFVAPLGEALAFSAEDLEKNRDGELSEAQLEKLTKDVRFNIGCMGPIAFGLFGLCLAVGVSAVILITSQVTSLRWFSLLSQIERAESSPSISSLYKIALALDSRIQDLFGSN